MAAIGAKTNKPLFPVPASINDDGRRHEEACKFDADGPQDNIACRQCRHSYVVNAAFDCPWIKAAETDPVR